MERLSPSEPQGSGLRGGRWEVGVESGVNIRRMLKTHLRWGQLIPTSSLLDTKCQAGYRSCL